MTLRIMLVSLVASLGLELPSGSDVSCWAKASTAWVQARMLDEPGAVVEHRLDPAVPADFQRVDETFEVPAVFCEKEVESDAAFKAVADEISAELSADLLASSREEVLGDPIDTKVAFEPSPPVGLPEGEETGCLVVVADEVKADQVAWTEEVVPADPVESPERVDRLSSAVRLTREAVQAWADLMQQTVEECHPTH